MVIVSAPRYQRNVEDIKTGTLNPYQANTRGPYITAYFKIDSDTPSEFVIGDGKTYRFKDKYYVNKPLEQNSSYIVFLRYFENEVNNFLKPKFLLLQFRQKIIYTH